MFRSLIALLLLCLPAHADGERAGDFDYYVVALSWTPTWCAQTGDARNSPQCDPGKGHGFTLHGLWPQYTAGGWPSFCRTSERNPSRAMTNDMADIMGTSGLAWHQWKKHGTCTGLSARAYYDLSREAYGKVNRPTVLRKLKKDITLPASVIEDAFMEANPKLLQNQVTITCKARQIQEVRICMTKDLELTKCGCDVSQDCAIPNAGLAKIR